jgi:hypothetical protein
LLSASFFPTLIGSNSPANEAAEERTNVAIVIFSQTYFMFLALSLRAKLRRPTAGYHFK